MKERLGKQRTWTGVSAAADSLTPLEPFVEPLGADRVIMAPAGYRFGYRNVATGETVCAVEVPAEPVERTVMSQLSLSVTMTADGSIGPLPLDRDGSALASDIGTIARPIDDIVAQATSPDGLGLEGPSAADLKSLLARLERSVALVRVTLTRVEQDQGSSGN